MVATAIKMLRSSLCVSCSTYYEAGLSDLAWDQMRSDYAANLTEAPRFAAYAPGQNDAVASFRTEMRRGVYPASTPPTCPRRLPAFTMRWQRPRGPRSPSQPPPVRAGPTAGIGTAPSISPPTPRTPGRWWPCPKSPSGCWRLPRRHTGSSGTTR